jgi:hypothetical protein
MSLAWGHDQPRLSWVGGKLFPQSGDSRKNSSGHGPEHTRAVRENVGVEIEQAVLRADQKLLTESLGEGEPLTVQSDRKLLEGNNEEMQAAPEGANQ